MRFLPRDVVFALRKLSKSPGFTFLAVLTLALGIGLNSAVFSVVNAVLFRPLPVASPEELVNLYTVESNVLAAQAPLAFPDYLDFVDKIRTVDDFAAYTSTSLLLEHAGQSEPVLGEIVSGNYFDLLGIETAVGRTFGVDEDRRGDPRFVAVISHGAWQRRFGGDPGIVGRQLRINGHDFTVVGVTDPSFFGMLRGVSCEVWVPIRTSSLIHAGSISNWGQPTEGVDRLDDRARRWHFAVGRLAPGATFAQASSEIETLGGHLRQEYADTHEKRSFTLVPTDQVRVWPGVDQALFTASFVVMGVVALVLLIACANLANMLLARAVERRKEMATRLALGASRGAVVRQLLVESLTLALLGGGAGLVLALASNAVIERLPLPIPVSLALGLALDFRVVAFTLAMASLAAVAFGLTPAVEATRTHLSSALLDQARGSSAGVAKHRLRNALVVAQVALSLVLLICAGLAVRSMGNAHRIDPGFDASKLVVASLSPKRQGYEDEQTRELYRQLNDRLAARSDVASVAFTSHLPLTLNISVSALAAEGRDSVPEEDWPVADVVKVGPEYFETMAIPLLHGRPFNTWDTADAPRVVVVNETLAEAFWPGESAIGQRLRFEDDDDFAEVVGVARSGKYRTLGEAPRSFVYRAIAQDWVASQSMVVRSAGDRAQLLTAVRDLIREIDPKLALSELSSVEDAISGALVLPRAGAALFGVFGAIGLILTLIGIYGVVSYLVSQRTHEIGIRMAVGARRRDILGLVVGESAVLTAVGIALGVAVASVVTRALSSILYGISPTDALTFTAVSGLLAAFALFATLVPALRASRLDPLSALRQD